MECLEGFPGAGDLEDERQRPRALPVAHGNWVKPGGKGHSSLNRADDVVSVVVDEEGTVYVEIGTVVGREAEVERARLADGESALEVQSKPLKSVLQAREARVASPLGDIEVVQADCAPWSERREVGKTSGFNRQRVDVSAKPAYRKRRTVAPRSQLGLEAR